MAGEDDVWVGITGHRPGGLLHADHELLRARVRVILDRVGGGVVSPLAEGADRIVAEEALVRGRPLWCIFPFDEAVYRDDFEGEESLAIFDALVSEAEFVEALDGDPSDPSGRTDAYSAVGKAVVDASDVLIAIWDGEAANGPGGTGEVVAVALAEGVPTVWIEADRPHAVHHWFPDEGEWHEVDADAFYDRLRG